MVELDTLFAKEIVEHGLREFPNEACGLIAGSDGSAVKVFAMRNMDASPMSYRLDPKEQLEVFVEGTVMVLDDYRRLSIVGSRAAGLSTRTSDKGQRDELVALAEALRRGEWPIPLWQQAQATEIALAVEPYLTGAG